MKCLIYGSGNNYNTAWVRDTITDRITQGVTLSQRIGDTITVWRLEVYLFVNVSATSALPRETVRFVIWKELVPLAPVNDYTGLYDQDFTATDACVFGVRKRRNMTTSIGQILWDRPMRMVTPNTPPLRGESTRHYKKIVLNWKRGLRVNYTTTGSQVPAAGRQMNGLFLNSMGEQGVLGNYPNGAYQFRLFYTDA